MPDFTSLIPVGGSVDPANLAAALEQLDGKLGYNGAPPAIAGAATTAIFAAPAADVMLVSVTGTSGTISSFGTNTAGDFRLVRFASAGLVVNHSAAIECPGATSITAEAGTRLLVEGLGSSNARVWDVWHPSLLTTVTSAMPRGHLFGLTLANNTADPQNDIDIATGEARDETNTANMILSASLTKRLDAAWAVGTNQGGLDAGSKASNTSYHLWLISNGTTVDALFSTSAAAPTMPSGYTLRRRIGAVRTDGSSNVRAFVQDGDEFLYAEPPLDFNASTIGTTSTSIALSVPDGIKVQALLRFYSAINPGFFILLRSLDESDQAPSLTVAPLHNVQSQSQSGDIVLRTNTSRQVAARASAAGQQLRLVTRGWIDRRGRLA